MDPAFWNNLPAILAATFAGITAIIGILQRRDSIRLGKKLDENTEVTVRGKEELYDKVDSATKEVTEQATFNTKAVATAAIKTALIAEKTAIRSVEQNQGIAQNISKIEEKLNGGPGGLTNLTNRVVALEAMYSEVVKGQVNIVKSIEHIAEVVDRKLGLKEV